MGNTSSEYLNEGEKTPATTAEAKAIDTQVESEQAKRAIASEQRTKIDGLYRESYKRDAGMLTAHLPRVNPLTKFTVAQHTGMISPPTRGQLKDPRGLPAMNTITETPAFLQQADRSEAYLDTRELAALRRPRNISFV